MQKNLFIFFISLFSLLIFASEADAIRSTKHESFTDPDYEGYRPERIAVIVENTNPDSRQSLLKKISEKFEEFGIQAVDFREFLPPTRQWTPEQRAEIYARERIDTILVVTAGENSFSAIPFATQTYGTVSVSGSVFGNSYSGNGYSSSTTYNLYAVKSKADYSAILLDVKNSRTVWYVDIRTKAGGYLFVGDKRDGKAVAKEIIEALEDDGHIIEVK